MRKSYLSSYQKNKQFCYFAILFMRAIANRLNVKLIAADLQHENPIVPMHEHTPRHTAQIQSSSDRSFGFVFAAVFLIIALYPLLNAQGIRIWSIVVAGIFLLLATLVPRVLGLANRLWTKFGLLLHNLVSPIALGILFFFVVTPTGLLMRLFGKDPLRLCFDPAADSYWIKRDPPGPAADSLKNQF